MLGRIVCLFTGHRINRKRVWSDGLTRRATCRSCGTPMICTDDGWRAFDSALDASTSRQPHPRAR